MNTNSNINYIEIENYEEQKQQICENFSKFLSLNCENKKIVIFLFDLDNVVFTQKNPYVKEPKFNQISEIGKIQKNLINTIKQTSNVYVIGITNKSLNERDKQIIKEQTTLNDVISRGQKNKSYGYNLQKQQIEMIKQIQQKYVNSTSVFVAFLNNRTLELECLNYFTFVPDLKVYRNNLQIIIPLIYVFIKGSKVNNK